MYTDVPVIISLHHIYGSYVFGESFGWPTFFLNSSFALIGENDVNKVLDSLQATHVSDTPDVDDSWKLLSVESFTDLESSKLVGDDDSFELATEDVFKRLSRLGEWI